MVLNLANKIKSDVAKENGFELLVIWESEYKKFPEETLEKCIKFLNPEVSSKKINLYDLF